jgi:hypothetical protein
MIPRPQRQRWIVPLVLLVAGIAAWLGVEWWTSRQPLDADFSNEVAAITGDVPEPPTAPVRPDGPVRLAIGPLGMGSTQTDGEAADLLNATLSSEPGLQLVERRELVRLMAEIELGAAGAVKPADALRLGKLVRADWFLLGGTYRGTTATNAVIRLVDAGTGILRNLSVVPVRPDAPVEVATTLAALVRQELGATNASARGPEYVALGGFADVGLSPRFADLEPNLRAHLAGALAGTPFVQLERELTTLLLEEVRLQQVGLVESGASLPRIQSAFWLVDGFWQPLDSVGDDVELNLRVSRIGGAVQRRNLRATRGAPLESTTATTMLELIRNAPSPDRPATRKGEIRAQLAKGMERAGFTDESLGSWMWANWWSQRWNRNEQELANRREHLQAAMQSFETVLLLDPGNGMAKLFLARCLVDPAVARPAEARGLYRELLDDKNGMVARTAMESLGASFEAYGEFDRAIATFRDLESRAPESLKRGLRQRLEFASRRNPEPGRGLVDWEEREAAAMKSMAAWREEARTRGHYSDSPVISDFLAGPEQQAAERLARLEGLLPRLLAAAPELEPHLLTLTLRHWPATNHPFLPRFEASLKAIRQTPTNLLAPGRFFSRLAWDGFGWAFDHKLNALAAEMSDTVLAARNAGVKFDFMPAFQMRVALAYSYANRPRDAVEASRLVEREVVAMDSGGPWGRHPSWLMRDALRRYNQEKIGEPPEPDANAFGLGEAMNIPGLPFLFVPDGEQLWLVNANRVWNLPVAGGASITNAFALDPELNPAALQQTADALWIGSDRGLFRVDKRTRTVRQWTPADGLLLDGVRSLWLDGQRLWIGYELRRQSERRWIGGVSELNLADAQIRSFIPPLGESRDQRDEFDRLGSEPDWQRAPSRPVRAFARTGANQVVAAVAGVGLQTCDTRTGQWSASEPKVADRDIEVLAASTDWLVAGEAPYSADPVRRDALTIVSRRTGEQHRLGIDNGLPFPAVTALALDGDRVWVGGPCYLLILDLPTRSVVRRCMMNNTTVHHLQMEGETVWVRLNRAIYRFPRLLAK